MSDPGWQRSDVRRRQRYRRRRRLRLLGVVVLLAAFVIGGWAILKHRRDLAANATPTVAAPPIRLTFPEGLRREEMAKLLNEKTHLSGQEYLDATGPGTRGAEQAGVAKATSLEGFLFPATYEIGTQTTVPYLVDRQLAAFTAAFGTVNMTFAKSRNLTKFDVVIIASMVEREVVVPAERPIVAGVIYNRLKRKMRLDIDATVQYAVGAWRPLTAADLASDSPYNTRKFPGLPPGPIANPGLASIEAAARPKRSAFLYYVAREDGTNRHYFARSLNEFETFKTRARANAAAKP
jgi:UPF0755 protein